LVGAGIVCIFSMMFAIFSYQSEKEL